MQALTQLKILISHVRCNSNISEKFPTLTTPPAFFTFKPVS